VAQKPFNKAAGRVLQKARRRKKKSKAKQPSGDNA
jgi:hypothetical protein